MLRSEPLFASIFDHLLSIPPWLALVLVFLLPALEASAFVGFLFPGEIAIVVGGVLAYEEHLSLAAVLVAAVCGAVVGDSVGYYVGQRWGRRILRRTLGKLPIYRHHLERHMHEATRYIQRRGPVAVLIGRLTAGLRVTVPGLAGMSHMPYRKFLLYNVIGGVMWATAFVLLGFFAGAGWRRVEHIAGRAGLALLAAVVLILVLGRRLRRASAPPEQEQEQTLE